MRRLLLAFAAAFALLLAPAAAHAGPISLSVSVDLGPTGVITSGQWPENTNRFLSMPLDAFAGALLDGSVWDLDIHFADSEFLRVFTASGQIDLGLTFYTDVDARQFLGDGTTGGLIDKEGTRFGSGAVGRSYFYGGDQVGFNAGLFPGMMSDGSSTGELARPYDVYGVYYHLIFPDSPGARVTGAEFNVYVSNPDYLLGVGPGIPVDIVPDPGSTLLLCGIGLAGLGLWRKRWQ